MGAVHAVHTMFQWIVFVCWRITEGITVALATHHNLFGQCSGEAQHPHFFRSTLGASSFIDYIIVIKLIKN